MHHLEGQLFQLAQEVMKADEILGKRLLNLAGISSYYSPNPGINERKLFESSGILPKQKSDKERR